MLITELRAKGLISPPKWLDDNIVYLTIFGSIAYGAADTTKISDFDVYGICIPNKSEVFPHLKGDIVGFGRNPQRFEQWQQHHIFDPDALGGKGREYDFSVYNIVKFFNLLMENNPSCIDTLFTPYECILHITKVGNLIRDNRRLFLHKGCWPKFKGYSYSMLHKMNSKTPQVGSKRANLREEFGFDTKYAMHLVRLLGEAEMILAEGDLDLRRNSEQLKAIRRGEVSSDDIIKWAQDKEKQLENLYVDSKLPWGPDEGAIKKLLLECLELHYGSLSADCIVMPDKYEVVLRKIKEEIEKSGL